MLVGQATIPTAYIAGKWYGLALGQSWATKDTLDGIIIATGKETAVDLKQKLNKPDR